MPPAETTNNQITDSVASANLKNLGDMPAQLSHLSLQGMITAQNLALQNAVSHQGRLNALSEAALATGIRSLHVQPMEEADAHATTKHTQLAGQIEDNQTALNSGQLGAKAVMTMPPETGLSLAQKITDLSAAVAALTAMVQTKS